MELTEREKEALVVAFQQMDKDRNGVLDREEFRESMKIAGMEPSEDELDRLIKDFDTNRDGTIDIEEFINAMTPKKDIESE